MKRLGPICGILIAVLIVGISHAQRRSSPKPKRSVAPNWSKRVTDVFFADAREKLAGERPDFANQVASTPKTGGPSSSGGPPAAAGGVFAWSALLTPEAIEDEIKAQSLLVNTTVSTPGKFKGGGNREARKQFSVLAVMFAIAAEYDGKVRWQEDASGLRDMFAQAGFSCKVGTDQSYNQSKLRKQDLSDLVRGQKVESKASDPKAQWDKVSNRPPLMSRLEEAFDKRLKPWLSSEAEFKDKNDQIYHEAQIVATLAETIQREGFEYWDDEDYLNYCKKMRQGALDIVEGVKLKSYDKARSGAGEITKSCSECHEGYRS